MNRTPIDVIVSTPPQCVVVVGEFDGVHLRHRRLIAMGQVRADRLGAPMFAIVLDTDSPWPQLSIPRRRCELLVSCGVSRAHLISDAGSDELTDTVKRLGPAELLIDSESLTPPDGRISWHFSSGRTSHTATHQCPTLTFRRSAPARSSNMSGLATWKPPLE